MARSDDKTLVESFNMCNIFDNLFRHALLYGRQLNDRPVSILLPKTEFYGNGGDSTPRHVRFQGKRYASIGAKISIEPPDHFLMMNPIKK